MPCEYFMVGPSGTRSFFLLDLPRHVNIHKESKNYVLYHPWHGHCIIWEINLRQNISSGASNCLLLSFMVNVKCNSAVMFLWENTEKFNKEYIM